MRFVFAFVILFKAGAVLSCSPGIHRDSFYIDSFAEVEWSTELYPPIVEKISVWRSYCDFVTIKLQVALPEESFYKVSDVGFYFISIDSSTKNKAFPRSPKFARKEDGKYYLILELLDLRLNDQVPLELSFKLATVLKDSTISQLSNIISVQEGIK